MANINMYRTDEEKVENKASNWYIFNRWKSVALQLRFSMDPGLFLNVSINLLCHTKQFRTNERILIETKHIVSAILFLNNYLFKFYVSQQINKILLLAAI